jgi:ketosteroid isomerase-like protein
VDVRELVALEEDLWRAAGDAAAYASHLAGDAVHVFPGWGLAERDAVLDGVAAAAPWTSFSIEEPRILPLGDEAAALVYTARASREGTEYRAGVTSVYRRDADGWRLVVHQQTPL